MKIANYIKGSLSGRWILPGLTTVRFEGEKTNSKLPPEAVFSAGWNTFVWPELATSAVSRSFAP